MRIVGRVMGNTVLKAVRTRYLQLDLATYGRVHAQWAIAVVGQVLAVDRLLTAKHSCVRDCILRTGDHVRLL